MLRLTLPQQQVLQKSVSASIYNQIELLTINNQNIDDIDLKFIIHLLNVAEYFKVDERTFIAYLWTIINDNDIQDILAQHYDIVRRLITAGIIECTDKEIKFIATKLHATDTLPFKPYESVVDAEPPLETGMQEQLDSEAILRFFNQLDDEYQALPPPLSPLAQATVPTSNPQSELWDFSEILQSPPPVDPVIQELLLQPLSDVATPQVQPLQDLSRTESHTNNSAPAALTPTSLIQDELRNLSQQLKVVAAASQPKVKARDAYASLSRLLSELDPDVHSSVEREHAEKVQEKIKQGDAKKRLRGDDSSSSLYNDEEIDLLQKEADRRTKNRHSAVNHRVNAKHIKLTSGLILDALSARVDAMTRALEPAAPPVAVIPSSDTSAPAAMTVVTSLPNSSLLQSLSITNSFNQKPGTAHKDTKHSRKSGPRRR